MSALQINNQEENYLSQYPLVFHTIPKKPGEQSRIMRAKKVTNSDFVFFDPMTTEKSYFTQGQVRSRFTSDERNKRFRAENFRKSKNIYDYE